MARSSESRYVANTSFSCNIDGDEYRVRKYDLVAAGHVLLKSFPDNFDGQSTQAVKYDVPVEAASAAPGEKRNR
jgi:hypothetical protein